MRNRPAVLTIFFVLAAAGMAAPPVASGQSPDNAWQAPRTAEGRPDLQGVWDFRSLTPFERPESVGDQDTFTEEEAAQFTQERLALLDKDRPGEDGRIPLSGGYNDFWWDYGRQLTDDLRTSLVVDPPTGRVPALTDAGETRVAARRAALGRDAHGPEDRGAFERCILGFNAGPPMNPSAYNNNMQLFQTAGYVVILNEMVHDARIIPLDGSGHLPDGVRQWRGDSRGRWEGETLVIETRNFTDRTSFRGSGPNLHLVERFTRVAADTLLYEYTVTDPESFERDWSVAVPMRKNDLPVFEYACHEGNYGMLNLMVSARAEDARKGAR
ncbi:MAG: hypothetical protein F4Z04_15290 [Acidobacteria bacterium]|nr:hypothetical protein [Acidobacteriota bacterium]